MARKKKTERQLLIKQADDLFRHYIYARDGYRCVRCGSEKALQCSHVITRGNKRLRWELRNAMTLCMPCHLYWWHRNPIEAVQFMEQKYSEDYKFLLSVQFEKGDISLVFLREIVSFLQGLGVPRRYMEDEVTPF